MIRLQQLNLERGGQPLLQGADLSLHSGDKVGLVGANGSGKSSLFELLLGRLQPDAGELDMPSSWRIAWMAQEVPAGSRSALDFVLDGDAELRRLQAAIRDLETAGDASRLGELHAEMERIDGYRAEARARRMLSGLGFADAELEAPLTHFSGGWRVRLSLARTLMCPSDLLLLDEPTNHLDLDAILWLEGWLQGYPGTLVLVSHDRDFLDRVVDRILHLERQSLQLYSGNYSAFERLRAERLAQQDAAYRKQQQRVAEIETFVRRFRAQANKARQAQSRLKELERMEEIAPAHVDTPFSFRFVAGGASASPLIALEEACLGYSGQGIIRDCNLSLEPGERLGLLGPNGAGKSTLIKSLTGALPLLGGWRHPSPQLRIGYFAQHQLEALDLEASPLLHLQRLAPEASEQRLRDFAGSFGFKGDDALTAAHCFSGGEKARLALALLAWQQPDLLLLDEPTNHLDLEVRHALTLALQAFAGALILVSHDRHLLRNSVDAFLLVADHQVQPFAGDLDDYADWLRNRQRQATQPATAGTTRSRRDQKREAAARRRQLSPLKQQVRKLEEALEQRHRELALLEKALAEPELYEAQEKARLKETLARQAEVEQAAAEIEERWLAESERLEALAADLEGS